MLLATLLPILKTEGYTVAGCEGPEEALEYCERHPRARVLLTDIVFQESSLTGVDLAEQITRISAARTILMSHYERGLVATIAGFERYPFLPLPFSAAQVLAAVSDAWSRGAVRARRSPTSPATRNLKQRRIAGD